MKQEVKIEVNGPDSLTDIKPVFVVCRGKSEEKEVGFCYYEEMVLPLEFITLISNVIKQYSSTLIDEHRNSFYIELIRDLAEDRIITSNEERSEGKTDGLPEGSA